MSRAERKPTIASPTANSTSATAAQVTLAPIVVVLHNVLKHRLPLLRFVLNELIQTEKDYVKDLGIVVEVRLLCTNPHLLAVSMKADI